MVSVFTIKRLRVLAALEPVGLLIVKTLTNVLIQLEYICQFLHILRFMSGILIIKIPKLAVFMKQKFIFLQKYGVLIGRKNRLDTYNDYILFNVQLQGQKDRSQCTINQLTNTVLLQSYTYEDRGEQIFADADDIQKRLPIILCMNFRENDGL